MSQDVGPSEALTEAPKKKRRKGQVLVVIVVVIVLLCALLYLLLAPAISNVSDKILEQVGSAQEFYAMGDAFLTALKNDNYDQAYDLFVPELQQETGDVAALQSMVEDNQAQPGEWKWTAFNLSTGESGVQTAALEGGVTYLEGREGAVTLEMVKVGGEWKLISFNLTW